MKTLTSWFETADRETRRYVLSGALAVAALLALLLAFYLAGCGPQAVAWLAGLVVLP